MYRLLPVILVLALTNGLEEDEDRGFASLLRRTNLDQGRSSYRGENAIQSDMIVDGLDMILTPEQKQALYSDRAGFGGSFALSKPWTDAQVYYTIETNFTDRQVSEIREGMDLIEKYTCLEFHEKGPNDANYINIQGGWSGCNSLLGMRGGKQDVNLAEGGCRLFGVYVHEIGHALGLVHEHQLPTRDEYVQYNAVNIDPLMVSQLSKYGGALIKSHGTEYDLSSIMHYELTGFSWDGVAETLSVPNQYMERFIGQRTSRRLSFGDIKVLNRLYKCKDRCRNPPRCPEPGFLNKDCQCVTPQSYKDESCTDDPTKEAWCYQLVKEGKCDGFDLTHQTLCPRACDLCPRFIPGEKVKPWTCDDQYVDPGKCQEWAAAGDCDKHPTWMHQWCTKSCDKCSEGLGKCPDHYPASNCAEKKANGECTSTWFSFVIRRCRHTCNTCGLRRVGNCPNEHPDDECHQRMLDGECESNPLVTFKECRKACYRCDFQAGPCNNKPGHEEECQKRASRLSCRGGYHQKFVEENCPKACNTCTEEDIREAKRTTTTTTTTIAPTTTTTAIPCLDKYSERICRYHVNEGRCTWENNDGFFARKGCRKMCNLC